MQLSEPAAFGAQEESRIGEMVLYNGDEVLPVSRPGKKAFEREQKRAKRRAVRVLREALDIPQRIPVPGDTPLHASVKGDVMFPKHRYENRYVEGWNACLDCAANTKCDLRTGVRPQSFNSFKNDSFSAGGLAAGISDCSDRIRLLATIYETELIRKTARELHREIQSDIAWRHRDPLVGKRAKKEKRVKALAEIPDLPRRTRRGERRINPGREFDKGQNR